MGLAILSMLLTAVAVSVGWRKWTSVSLSLRISLSATHDE